MTRRLLLEMLVAASSAIVAAVVAVPAFIASLSPVWQRRRTADWRLVGPLQDFPLDTMSAGRVAANADAWPRSFGERLVFVWRKSEDELIVFSRSCTDLGCALNYEPGSACFFCPCHGGIFAQDGQRLAGPPNRPMDRYEHRIRNGLLEVDVASLLPAA